MAHKDRRKSSSANHFPRPTFSFHKLFPTKCGFSILRTIFRSMRSFCCVSFKQRWLLKKNSALPQFEQVPDFWTISSSQVPNRNWFFSGRYKIRWRCVDCSRHSRLIRFIGVIPECRSCVHIQWQLHLGSRRWLCRFPVRQTLNRWKNHRRLLLRWQKLKWNPNRCTIGWRGACTIAGVVWIHGGST